MRARRSAHHAKGTAFPTFTSTGLSHGADVTKQRRQRRRAKRSESRTLVSGFSILIFGGFLIGMAASHAITNDLRIDVMMGGIVGVLAFLGLDQAKALREKIAVVADRLHVEGRLDRHIGRLGTDLDELPDDVEDADEEQATTAAAQTIT